MIRIPKSTLTGLIARWFLPATFAVFVLVRCVVVSGKRLLWADELFTWYPAAASFGRMFSSTLDTINSAPPLYFMTAWAWGGLFGVSAVSLRLLSAVAVAVAIFTMFALLRRVYGPLAAFIGIVIAFSDRDILFLSTEARLHTMILGETAIAILMYQRLIMQRRPQAGWLVINAVIHACMVMTHYLGPLYSGAILSGVLLMGLSQRRGVGRISLSIMTGWLIFLPWIPAFLRHRGMGKPTFWISPPDPAMLQGYFTHFLSQDFWQMAAALAALAAFTFLLALLGCCGWWRRLRFRPFYRREASLLLLVPGISIVPLLVYFVSTRPGAPSIFGTFYMISCALGWAILCAWSSHGLLRLRPALSGFPLSRVWPVGQTLLVVLLLGFSGWHELRDASRLPVEQPPVDVPESNPKNEPVVIEHIHDFLKLNFYSPDAQRYRFVVDPEVGLAEGGGGPLNHQIMAALRRQFPARFKGVVTTKEFLDGTNGFWVKRAGMHWWPMRVEHNPAFAPDTDSTASMVHVHRVP